MLRPEAAMKDLDYLSQAARGVVWPFSFSLWSGARSVAEGGARPSRNK